MPLEGLIIDAGKIGCHYCRELWQYWKVVVLDGDVVCLAEVLTFDTSRSYGTMHKQTELSLITVLSQQRKTNLKECVSLSRQNMHRRAVYDTLFHQGTGQN